MTTPDWPTLVREHGPLAFHVARGVLKDPAAAEDAAQDVFFHLFQHPEALSGASNERAYIARAALNRALEIQRSGKRRARREEAASHVKEEEGPMEAAHRADVRAKVGELPEEQRRVVDLHYFRGLSLSEVAEALEIPPGTVASRVSAALKRLRTALAGVLAAALLETELRACGFDDVAPPDLAHRLLGRRGSPRSGRAGRAAGIVAAVLAIAFLAFLPVLGRLLKDTDGGSGGGLAAAAPKEPGPAGAGEPVDNGSGKAPKEAEGNPPAPPRDLRTYEGFLTRRKSGLGITDKWLGPRQSLDGLHFADEKPFEGLPLVGKSWDYGDVIKGTRPPAERECVYLRVRGEVVPGEPESYTASFKVEKILLLEVIKVAWIEPALRLREAADALSQADRLEPGAAKRKALLDASAAVIEAWHAARAARAGDANACLRPYIESTYVGLCRARLEIYGLDGDFQGDPSGTALVRLFHESSSPADYRRRLLASFGESVLSHTILVYPDGMKRGAEDGRVQTPGALCAMEAAEFDALKAVDSGVEAKAPRDVVEVYRLMARSLGKALKTGLKGAADPEVEKQRAARALEREAAAGWTLAELDAVERGTFVLSGGVRIATVDAGGKAERAGLRGGDIIWSIDMPAAGKHEADSNRITGREELRDELLRAVESGRTTVTLRILRDGSPTSVDMEP